MNLNSTFLPCNYLIIQIQFLIDYSYRPLYVFLGAKFENLVSSFLPLLLFELFKLFVLFNVAVARGWCLILAL